MPRSTAVAAPQTDAVDEVVMAAVAVKRRAVKVVRCIGQSDGLRLVLKALREFDEALNALARARDGKGGSDGH